MRQWILMWCDVLVNLIDKKGWLDCFVMCLLTAYWWVSKDQSWQLTTHLLCYRVILYNKVCFQCRHQVEQLRVELLCWLLYNVYVKLWCCNVQCVMLRMHGCVQCTSTERTSEIDKQFKWSLRRNGSLNGFDPGCRNVDS